MSERSALDVSVYDDAEAAGIRSAMLIPVHIPVTLKLCLGVDRIKSRRDEWLADGRKIFAALDNMGAFKNREPDGGDLLALVRDWPRAGPGRQLRLLQHAQRILRLIDMPVEMTSDLITYRAALKIANADGKRPSLAISNGKAATAITIDDLVPVDPNTLADAVERAALLGLESFAGREHEGTQITFRLIKKGRRGYYVDGAWSKTGGRRFRLKQPFIDAINHIATLPGGEGRHRIGIDPDENMTDNCDALIPRFDSNQTGIKPGFFHRQWYGKMVKRRVRAYLEANKVSRSLTARVMPLVGGKAGRRGRNADNVRRGVSARRQSRDSNLKTRDLMLRYADGMMTEDSHAETTVLGMVGRAMRGEI